MITVDVDPDRTGQLRLAVEDTGLGIAEEKIGRIFTKFSQADASITRKFGGTGLGLSISKQLTELMGGNIRVESQIGIGSRFTISVPFVVTDHANPFRVSRALTVAIIDSDDISRRAISNGLRDRGMTVVDTVDCVHDVVFVRDGDAASLGLAETTRPIILLRSFAANTVALPGGRLPVLDVPMPVSRIFLDKFCEALDRDRLSTLKPQSEQTERSQIPDLKSLRVLAVDDVAVNREVLGEALRTFNIDCDVADSGRAAINAIGEGAYDLVFMDCSMPDMDGFEATHEIRKYEAANKRHPALVVALTGHVMGRDAGRWKEAGMNGYLAKPFNIGQLQQLFLHLGVMDKVALSRKSLLVSKPVALWKSRCCHRTRWKCLR
ncbi:response regulator (plasmid) [Rhizobium sp. 32-5/1]|uniref:response regulator n=1 Tax=Rhizobium sp. 32-5/1 TaxID=3019602 RepID=UPI00240D83DA|nr:response regulator [Rhizobium sp. 32-5/1]WEZ86095.1 response regulator [Rhizobium sp. 32-5/1]